MKQWSKAEPQHTMVQELSGGQMETTSFPLPGSGFSVFILVVCKLLGSGGCLRMLLMVAPPTP